MCCAAMVVATAAACTRTYGFSSFKFQILIHFLRVVCVSLARCPLSFSCCAGTRHITTEQTAKSECNRNRFTESVKGTLTGNWYDQGSAHARVRVSRTQLPHASCTLDSLELAVRKFDGFSSSKLLVCFCCEDYFCSHTHTAHADINRIKFFNLTFDPFKVR